MSGKRREQAQGRGQVNLCRGVKEEPLREVGGRVDGLKTLPHPFGLVVVKKALLADWLAGGLIEKGLKCSKLARSKLSKDEFEFLIPLPVSLVLGLQLWGIMPGSSGILTQGS